MTTYLVRNEGYFHDGRIIDIKHHKDNLDIWMESSELIPQWSTNLQLSKEKTIRGILHIKGVSEIEINDEVTDKKIEFNYDSGLILGLEINQDTICILDVTWDNYNPSNQLHEFESIKITAKEIEWENLPNLEIPEWLD